MTNAFALTQIINETIEEAFTAEYRATADPKQIRIQALGIIVSRFTEWDGIDIMKIFAEALDDANFHGEAAQVQTMIEAAEAY